MHESAAFDGADSCPGTMQDRPGPWRLLRKTVNEGDILQVEPRNEILPDRNMQWIIEIAFGKIDLCLLMLERVLLDRPSGAVQDD